VVTGHARRPVVELRGLELGAAIITGVAQDPGSAAGPRCIVPAVPWPSSENPARG
jgi:hypothetical protein